MSSLAEITRQIDPSIRSDKSDAYLAFYEELFGKIADQPLNILEVGIFDGGSLLMFSEYFKNARILGIDLNAPPAQYHQAVKERSIGSRLATAQGSQSDKRFLLDAIQTHFGQEKLDIVIDDASHLYKPSRATFDTLFQDHVRSGGYYVIEDWGCGYWPKWGDGNPNGKSGLPKLIKELIDLTALGDRTKLFLGKRAMQASEQQESPIARMIVVPSIVALLRA